MLIAFFLSGSWHVTGLRLLKSLRLLESNGNSIEQFKKDLIQALENSDIQYVLC